MADAREVELLCLDVDGVMTDGGIRLDDDGVETKRFHVRDGTGIRIWTQLGHGVAVITGRPSRAVEHRARELGIEHIIQGSRDKKAAFVDLLHRLRLPEEQTAILADDLPDLPIMRLTGYAMAVADAVTEVRSEAAFVTSARGGHGAVREAVEHLLKAKNQWAEAVSLFE